MSKMEVFFDYSCPFCLKGHEFLMDLIGNYPKVEIEWVPCEAHPRPEPGPHSDLCIQGMFFALENGADLDAYHDRMYKAILKDRIDREDIDALADLVSDILDADAFKKALKSGLYRERQLGNNKYTFEQSGVWAVPSYRMDGKKLDSIENVGVSKEDLADFMAGAR
ncbi:MAG: thioredoxin domain-containing protein [Oscillospiraceae bacterium]|jgi:predicted DsbA family dithiol-disulfide isomerase|nr:thioredoxin domain-containing protein [Oscillospiraceae bacterium]